MGNESRFHQRIQGVTSSINKKLHIEMPQTAYKNAELNLIDIFKPNNNFFSSGQKTKEFKGKKLLLGSTIINTILGVGNYTGFQNKEYENLVVHEGVDLIQTNNGPILFIRRASYGDISVEVAEYLILLNQECDRVTDIRYANSPKRSNAEVIDNERKKIILEIGNRNWTSLLEPDEEFKSVKDLKDRTRILKISTEILQHMSAPERN